MGKGRFEKICDVCRAWMLDHPDFELRQKWLKCHSCGFCKIKKKSKTCKDPNSMYVIGVTVSSITEDGDS